MAFVKTNTKHHLNPPASITLKPAHARTQVGVQAQQHKALLQAPFQQWLFRRAIGGAGQVQPGTLMFVYMQ